MSLNKPALTLARAQSRLSAHSNFWVPFRDRCSDAISCDPIVVTTLLCPESALILKVRLELDRPTDDVLVLDRKGNKAERARVNDSAPARHQVSGSGWRDQPQNPLARPTRLANAATRWRWGRVVKPTTLQKSSNASPIATPSSEPL